ncbi:MAG TPA: glutamine phosphoribosylpyrophosphate amidotransferase [Candidatus Tectomicrobia bacterium]|nr:glutamine phosphoribosylpyrophosphate amidotransferase [Candidatus Tectomicrobia bacterium]
MCGIVGYFDRRRPAAPVGRILLEMLTPLGGRGPDSTGVALWRKPVQGLIVWVKPAGREAEAPLVQEILERAHRVARVRASAARGSLMRLVVDQADAAELAGIIEGAGPAVEVVSLGHRLEIVKQVESPRHLEATFGISQLTGSYGIGHTRMSTESRVDLSHSQPFWTHGTLDLAVVHNGHITNYHKLRRQYEQRGVRFYTENDSEIIGIYLADRMAQGLGFGDALKASVHDLDGSFSYLAASAEAFGFAKDRFCLKPLIVAETEGFVAIANEEVALRAALPGAYAAREAGAAAVGVWSTVLASPSRRRRRAA